MECFLKLTPPSICTSPKIFPSDCYYHLRFHQKLGHENQANGAIKISSRCSSSTRVSSRAPGEVRCISSFESLFCYDKPIPEEIIEKPVGLSLDEKDVGGNPKCPSCQAKGAILCATCCGSGLYVDSILESQGIIVKVRCLGCGGTGNIMCSDCGGRGHLRFN